MADCARDSDRDELVALKFRLDADDRIGLQQFHGRLHVAEVDRAAFDRFAEDFGENAGVDLQTEFESVFRFEAVPDAAKSLACDRLIQAKLPGPEVFTAERIVSEDLPAFVEHPFRVLFNLASERSGIVLLVVDRGIRLNVRRTTNTTEEDQERRGRA